MGQDMASGLLPYIPMLDKETYDKVKEHPSFKSVAALPALLSSPHADPAELETQARVRNKSTEIHILGAIARNLSTPEHVLSKLAGHKYASISKAAFNTMAKKLRLSKEKQNV